ncbi:MAG: aromatic amino acid lyase [Saprospiraceae bacterium]|nr:aromatic amino acid lyase [Saprospiraceae bacterium]
MKKLKHLMHVYKEYKTNRKYLESKDQILKVYFPWNKYRIWLSCNIRISDHELEDLQHNLVLSHACGMGEKVPYHICKIILLLKLKIFFMAFSGVRPEIVKT